MSFAEGTDVLGQELPQKQRNSGQSCSSSLQSNAAGYHRHNFRLPFLYGRLLKRWIFFSKKNYLFIITSIFSQLKNILIFCQKNSIIKAEKTFLRNITIWYALHWKIATFGDFWKILFLEKTFHFFKKTKNLNVLKNRSISVAFNVKFAYMLQVSEKREQTLRVKVMSKMGLEKWWGRKIFLPYCICGGKY